MNILQQLQRDEELRLHPYQDTQGIWTVGYGHNCQSTPITKRVADLMLTDDLGRVKARVDSLWPWASKLDDARYGVMLNMAYNMGVEGLSTFKKFLTAMQAHNWTEACSEMEDSRWWHQVGNRAKRLHRQVFTGQWQ